MPTPGRSITVKGLRGKAVFSADYLHRYELWRIWRNRGLRYVAFVCLNPSTADQDKNDPTVTRCVLYAKKWGYDGMCMLNMFAFRATLPKDMKEAPDPVGSANDEHILSVCSDAGLVLLGCGTHGTFQRRSERVVSMLAKADIQTHYLKLTKDGLPGHPLYLKSNLTPIRLGES